MNGDKKNGPGPLKQESALEAIPMTKGQAPTCPGKIEVPTREEQEALGAMRAIKERVRVLKKRLAAPGAEEDGEKSDQVVEIEAELERLREEWNRWEERRAAAARERMIILGHEEGPL